MAVDAGWSVRDLLCTACHFVAEAVARSVRERLPKLPPIQQMLLCGGGQHNGMLLRGIAARLPDIPTVRAAEAASAPPVVAGTGAAGSLSCGLSATDVVAIDRGNDGRNIVDAALEPTAAAVLTLLFIDQTPATYTQLTGTEGPRILGRLTPGAPASANRLFAEMAGHRRATMPLRSAM
jgi:1,6-anhydro-N-acetylmuramate kinase